MNRATVVLLLGLAGCGPFLRHGGGGAPEGLRVCVQNATAGYGNIVAHAGLTRFDVQPGEQVCKSVNGTGPSLRLTAVTTGGGAAGPLSFATTLQVGATSCWRWRLANERASQIDLVPCDDATAGSPGER